MSLKGMHRYHALWSIKRINRKGILFLVKPSEQSVWVRTQLEQIHPLHWTYRQTRCAEISARWHLCQNRYGNFQSMAGCHPMLMRRNLLRTEVFCWPFLANWEIVWPKKIIFCGPFYHCFKFSHLIGLFDHFLDLSWSICAECAPKFLVQSSICTTEITNCIMHASSNCTTRLLKISVQRQICSKYVDESVFFSLAMKTFGHGEHLLIEFGQKWEVTNCTIADFIL